MVEKGMEYPISEYWNGYSLVMQVPHQSNYDIIANVAVPSNTIEFLLDLLYYIYNYYCGYVPRLPQSSCPSGDFFVICCDCDLWLHCDVTILWLISHFCDSVTSYVIFPMLHLSKKRKEKKKKRNINNDLAILPSHDTSGQSQKS